MTEQEARKIIGVITLDRLSGEEIRALGIACKALEKQIPKKIDIRNSIHRYCPSCDLYFDNRDWKSKYCGRCGQAIKWE